MSRYNLRKRRFDEDNLSEDVQKKIRIEEDPSDYSDEEFVQDHEPEENLEVVEDSHVDPVRAGLRKVLIKKFGKRVDKQLLDKAIDFAMNRFVENVSEESSEEEFTPIVPEKLSPENKDLFERLSKSISDDTPTLTVILESKMSFQDKKKALELYNVLLSETPGSLNFIAIRDKIQDLVKTNPELSEEQVSLVEAKEKQLMEDFSVSRHTDLLSLKHRLFELDAEDKIKHCIYEKILKLQRLDASDGEYRDTREWVQWALALPYRKMAVPNIPVQTQNRSAAINDYCIRVRRILDEELYGMDRVKEELVQILVTRVTNPKSTGASIALKGPRGVGKTSIGKALAKALQVPYEFVPLGGMDDPSIFKGSDGHWLGSSPSIMLKILRNMKVCNGIVHFDEIDKLASDERGKAVQYALLHVSDYTSNYQFHDNFINEYTHDLSHLWFVYTMNDDSWLDPTLRDRLYIINVDKYTKKEKAIIIEKYVLGRALANVGMTPDSVRFSEDGLQTLMTLMKEQMEADGMRPVEKELRSIVSRINTLCAITLVDGTTGPVKLSYSLPNIKLPLTLDSQVVKKLYSGRDKPQEHLSYFN